jgi:hypothetical protein
MVKKAVEANTYNSKFFIYTDAGAWREKVFSKWPDYNFVKEVAEQIKDLPLFGQVGYGVYNYPWDDIIQATWFAGSAKALIEYEHQYYKVHDERVDRNLFVGKEQPLMTLVVFGPDRFGRRRRLNSSRIHMWELTGANWICGDKWFVFEKYFAQKDDYTCGKDRLSLLKKPDDLYTVDGYTIPGRK